MLQKVIKVGNSLAVTIPKSYADTVQLKAGQKVFVDTDVDLDLLQVRTKGGTATNLTPEFKDWLDKTSNNHSQTIKELANK